MTTGKPQPRYLPTLTEVVQPQERSSSHGSRSPEVLAPTTADLEAELRSALQLVAQAQIREFSIAVDQMLEQFVEDALARLGKPAGN
jgi:hypothetical protein